MLRHLFAAAIAVLITALALAGCATTPPPPPAWQALTLPPDEWLEDAAPLPDVPTCQQPTGRLRLACRVAYDEASRGQYVALAARHKAIAGWVRVVNNRSRRAAS